MAAVTEAAINRPVEVEVHPVEVWEWEWVPVWDEVVVVAEVIRRE
jgi:hypothetical protein